MSVNKNKNVFGRPKGIAGVLIAIAILVGLLFLFSAVSQQQQNKDVLVNTETEVVDMATIPFVSGLSGHLTTKYVAPENIGVTITPINDGYLLTSEKLILVSVGHSVEKGLFVGTVPAGESVYIPENWHITMISFPQFTRENEMGRLSQLLPQ